VGEPRKSYWGERSFPLIMQNVHRYFLYLALLFILILAYDVWKALWFIDPATGKVHFASASALLCLRSTFICWAAIHLDVIPCGI